MATRKTKTTTASKKNPWRSTHVPLPSWIMFWALILCTMALIVVNFSKAFAPAPVEAIDDTTAQQFAAIRTSLEQQVSALQSQLPQSGRVLTRGFMTEDCSLSWATSTANVYVPFQSDIRMTLPYNFDWGNSKYILTPFEADIQIISFGPAVNGQDDPEFQAGATCDVIRDSSIQITNDKRSVSEVKSALKNPSEGTVTNLKERTINGIPVLSYHVEGSGGTQNVWLAFGRTNRYNLYSHGWLTDAEAIKIIQSLKVVK